MHAERVAAMVTAMMMMVAVTMVIVTMACLRVAFGEFGAVHLLSLR